MGGHQGGGGFDYGTNLYHLYVLIEAPPLLAKVLGVVVVVVFLKIILCSIMVVCTLVF